MLVVGGSASEDLAKNISDELDCEFISVEKKRFPDGEIYVKIPGEVEGEDVVVVQSTYYPPNQNYMELFLTLDAASDLGADKVTAVIPYFAYARQDKRFEPGEAVSRVTVSKLIESAGADEVFTLELHSTEIGEIKDLFEIPAHNLTAAPTLAKFIERNFDLVDPVVMAPDEGAKEWAEMAGDSIGADWDYMVKEREGPEDIDITPRELSVDGRDVLVIDDIISTGGTMSEAVSIIRENGARKVYAACTHPVLTGEAPDNIEEAGAEEVISTDTIESEASKVSVAPVFAEAIRE